MQNRKRGRSAAAGVLYTAHHRATRHAATTKQRVGRNLLVSVYEQSRHILMVNLSVFGQIEDKRFQIAANHPALVKAVAMLRTIVYEYCNDKVAEV